MISPEMQVEVILASKGAWGPPVYTLRMRYPRIIHAEIMTHRVFSRNARSSRAVPAKVMLEEIRDRPFIPWHWGQNQAGMQAGEECEEYVFEVSREQAWLEARDQAVDFAQAFSEAGYHKQIFNRLVEPFMWIDTLVTATDWKNFLALRDHPAAEPHFGDLAAMVREALTSAKVQELEDGAWHLPYITADDLGLVWGWLKPTAVPARGEITGYLKKISAARCARISYAPFDGKADIASELARYDLLMKDAPRHASPVEHQAQVDMHEQYPQLSGNFAPGWIQYRKTIEGESVYG